MKILICGGSGQLGRDCTQVLGRTHGVVSLSSKELDISNSKEVEDKIDQIRPDVVLNCAAYTRVDECEKEKESAWRVNAEGPSHLAMSAKRHGSQLIHISTDYVFDGKKGLPAPYVEDDAPNPISEYGRSKLEGEQRIRQTTERHIIVRTAWLYGLNGHNFLKTMLRLALNEKPVELKVVNDQFGSPTWSYSLALQIEKLIKGKGEGTYHATSEGYCTWYQLAGHFLREMDIPHSLAACTTEEFPMPAPRPRNSILENKRLKDEGMHIMHQWKRDIEAFVFTARDRLIIEAKRLVTVQPPRHKGTKKGY
jgi:dTDP-4-dehydrorhamnose reductase